MGLKKFASLVAAMAMVPVMGAISASPAQASGLESVTGKRCGIYDTWMRSTTKTSKVKIKMLIRDADENNVCVKATDRTKSKWPIVLTVGNGVTHDTDGAVTKKGKNVVRILTTSNTGAWAVAQIKPRWPWYDVLVVEAR